MKDKRILFTISIVTLFLFGWLPPDTSMGGTGITPEQLSLLAFSQGYKLPADSVPPTAHEDREIAAIVTAMQDIAGKQALVFDGHKAAQGFVVVGKQGTNDNIVLILKLYRASNGRIAFQDVHLWNGADMDQGMEMRSRFLSALQ